MVNKLKVIILIVISVLICSNGIIFAQDQLSINELQQRLDAMEKIISHQQTEIENLKKAIESKSRPVNSGSSHESVFMREDVDQIVDEKIEEYFRDEKNKDKIASYVRPPLDIGYDKGFYMKTEDNKFSMKTNATLQFRYTFDDFDSEQDSSSFKVHRGRLKFSGNAFSPDLKYILQMETRSTGAKDGSKAVELVDFYGDLTHISKAKVRFGQWKVPFNRQTMTSFAKQQMVDRSEANNEFSLLRQLGVMVYGDVLDKRLEYYMGLWNGNFRNESQNDNNEHLWIFRTSYNPFGAYGYTESDLEYSESPLAHISGAVSFDSVDDATLQFEDIGDVTVDEIDRTQVVGEVGFKFKGLSILSEYYWRKSHGFLDSNIIDKGFFVQGGYFLIPKMLEIAGRYSLIDFDNELEVDAVRETTFGINYFIEGHISKLQFNAIRLDKEMGNSDNIDYKYMMQYQMSF